MIKHKLQYSDIISLLSSFLFKFSRWISGSMETYAALYLLFCPEWAIWGWWGWSRSPPRELHAWGRLIMSCCAVGQAGGDRCHATRVWLILEDSGCCQGESEWGPPWVGARGYASRALPQAPGSICIWGEPRGHRTLSPPHHATVCFFLLFPWQSCLSLSVLALFPSLSPNSCSRFPGVPWWEEA